VVHEALAGAMLVLATWFGEVRCVNHGSGIASLQNAVHAMATGAVCYGLRSSFRCQAVKRGIEAHHPVLRKPEFPGQAQIAVAAPAGLPDMSSVHRRSAVGVFDDAVLAMAV